MYCNPTEDIAIYFIFFSVDPGKKEHFYRSKQPCRQNFHAYTWLSDIFNMLVWSVSLWPSFDIFQDLHFHTISFMGWIWSMTPLLASCACRIFWEMSSNNVYSASFHVASSLLQVLMIQNLVWLKTNCDNLFSIIFVVKSPKLFQISLGLEQ